MRTLSGTLAAAQKAAYGTPYIRLVFTKGATTYDYSARLKRLVHVEEPYNSYAQIWLENHDLGTADLTGFYVDVGYGFTTGSGDEYSSSARMWVVQQSDESEPGRLETVLYLEGIWRILREIQDVGGIGASGPYLDVDYDGSTDTIYAILEDLLETCSNVDLDALGGVDDGIIDTLKPVFSINAGSGLFEDVAGMIYRLMNMTMCFLRPSGDYAGSKMAGFAVVHPQSGDSVDYSYYSHIADGHVFYQCYWKNNIVTPNHIYVFANQDEDGEWTSLITGEYDGSALYPIYDEDGNALDLPEYHLASTLTTQGNANNRAEAIFTKLFHEIEWGVAVVPHNCGQELFDKVKIYDRRGFASPETYIASANGGSTNKDDADWDTAHDAADAEHVNANNAVAAYAYHELGEYKIFRGFLDFDTSDIPSDATILSAYIQLKFVDKNDDDGGGDIYVVEGIQDLPIQADDFGDHLSKTTSGGYIDYANITVGVYNNITLNATGIGWINKGGTSKFCVRCKQDIDDSTPGASNINGSIAYGANTSGSEPKLVVTYYQAYPTSETGRIGSLVHRRDVDEGIYTLEITFGGISYSPPSSPGISGSGAYGGVPDIPLPEPAVTPLVSALPQPPTRYLEQYRDVYGFKEPMIAKNLTNLTPYAQRRAQELYEQGFIDEKGVPTAKGLQWAQQHPTEEAPRTYTDSLLGMKVYLGRLAREFAQRTGRVPIFPGAQDYAAGIIPYSQREIMQYQVGILQQRAGELRTREQILADIRAGKRTTTGGRVIEIPGTRRFAKGTSLREQIRQAWARGEKYFK